MKDFFAIKLSVNFIAVKSNIRVNIIRTIFIIIIVFSIYNYDLNQVLFSIFIFIFALLLLISGTESIILTDNVILFKFQRLIPIYSKTKSINLIEIKSIQFSEGKIDDIVLLLSMFTLEYVPGTIKSEDEIVIELSNGEFYRHRRVGTKNEMVDLIDQINKKIKND
jgi:hypothetical protein